MSSREEHKSKKEKESNDVKKEKREEKEAEERIMEQLRQCYEEMAQASDPFPHAGVLANRKSGPGAIFDEMNREFIARGAKKFRENPGEMQNTMFRWRRMLCMPPSSAAASTAEQYRHHYALFDVTSTSLSSTWVRGVMVFFKKQLKTCWISLERSSGPGGIYPSSAISVDASSRHYHQSPHPQGYLTANSIDLLRDVVAAHFSILSSSSSSSSASNKVDLLSSPQFLSALRLMPPLVNAFRLARNFCKAMLISPSSFGAAAASSSSSPFASFAAQRNRYPGSYRYPSLAASASPQAFAARNPPGSVNSPSGNSGGGHVALNDQDRFYTDIIRSEFGNAEWLRYLLSMLLGALQLRHSNDKTGKVLAELRAARMNGEEKEAMMSWSPQTKKQADLLPDTGAVSEISPPFHSRDRTVVSMMIENMTSKDAPFSPNEIFLASQQLLQWATGVETSRQFTQLLALLFIQEQCLRYFPHDFYRDQIVTLQHRLATLPFGGKPLTADGGVGEMTAEQSAADVAEPVLAICHSKPFREVVELLCRHVPMYLEALEPLAAATQCQMHFTSVILLQLFCVQYPTERELSCPLWTSGAVQPVKMQRRGSAGSGPTPFLRAVPSSSVAGGSSSSGTALQQQQRGGWSPTHLPSIHAGTAATTTGTAVSAAPSTSSAASPASGGVCRPPIHAELPAEQTFLYHMYSTVLAPLLRVYLQVDNIVPYKSSHSAALQNSSSALREGQLSSIASTLVRLAITAPLFVIPVSTRLLRWRVLQLGDQPMAAYAVGVSAFQIAMGTVLHQIVGQLKELLSSSETLAKQASAGRGVSAPTVSLAVLEDQIVWLLGHVMRMDMALWALLEEGVVASQSASSDPAIAETNRNPTDRARNATDVDENATKATTGTAHSSPSSSASSIHGEDTEGGGGSYSCSSCEADAEDHAVPSRRPPARSQGLTALKEGMHHLYAAFHQCLSSLHSTATAMLSILLVNSIHQYLYKAEHTNGMEAIQEEKKVGKARGEADDGATTLLDPASNRAKRKKQSKEREEDTLETGAEDPESENPESEGLSGPSHKRKKRSARSRERSAAVADGTIHPAGRGASSSSRKKRKFLGITISREEELQSLLRLSRCADVDVFYEKYKDLLVSRLLYYPDPSSSRTGGAGATQPSAPPEEKSPSMGVMPSASSGRTPRPPPPVTLEHANHGIQERSRSDEETDALKRYWEGKSLEYLELVADGHEAFHSAYQVYQQFHPLYLRVPAVMPDSTAAPPASRCDSPSPTPPDTGLVLTVMDWRQWNRVDGGSAAGAAGAGNVADASGEGNAAKTMPKSKLGGNSATPLPLPRELAAAAAEFDTHYARASDQKKHLRFNYSTALSSFTLNVTVPVKQQVSPASNPKCLRITVHTTLLIHRILLVVVAHKRKGVSLGSLTESVNATLVESEKTPQSASTSVNTSNGNAAPASMEIKQVFDLLKSLIEKDRLLQLHPPPQTSHTGTASGKANEPVIVPEQCISLNYDMLRTIASEGVDHVEFSHWPRPRLHASPFEDQQTPPQLQAFRMEKIKIWIVQQLKQKKMVTHEELWSHVRIQRQGDHTSNSAPLTFPVTSNLLKMAIEELIQKDLLKRSLSNPQQYEYNA